MRKSFLLVLGTLLAVSRTQATDVLLTNTLIFDGNGKLAYPADVRIRGDRIVAVARHLGPRPGA